MKNRISARMTSTENVKFFSFIVFGTATSMNRPPLSESSSPNNLGSKF